MATKNYLDLTGLTLYHNNIKQYIQSLIPEIPIQVDTTAGWNAQTTLVAEEDVIYIYSDYQTEGGETYAGFKLGDGTSYLKDLPFTDGLYAEHIDDTTIHITAAERQAWNGKIRCYIDPNDSETLILTTN